MVGLPRGTLAPLAKGTARSEYIEVFCASAELHMATRKTMVCVCVCLVCIVCICACMCRCMRGGWTGRRDYPARQKLRGGIAILAKDETHDQVGVDDGGKRDRERGAETARKGSRERERG